jgi:hypothetical protein
LDNSLGSFQGVGAEGGFDDFVLADVVDGLLVSFLELDQEIPQGWVI